MVAGTASPIFLAWRRYGGIVEKWLVAEKAGNLNPMHLVRPHTSHTWGYPVRMARKEFPNARPPIEEKLTEEERALGGFIQTWINIGLLVVRIDALFRSAPVNGAPE
jgi:hypothetical protein